MLLGDKYVGIMPELLGRWFSRPPKQRTVTQPPLDPNSPHSDTKSHQRQHLIWLSIATAKVMNMETWSVVTMTSVRTSGSTWSVCT